MDPSDRFELGASVGRDELGEVFRATERASGRRAAVKVFDAWTLEDPRGRDAYASALVRLRDIYPARTPPIADFSLTPEHGWIASRWADGETLGSVMSREGSLPVESAAAIVCGILDALDELHSAFEAHGGLSPGKVLLTAGQDAGGVVVTDPFQHYLYRVDDPIRTSRIDPDRFLGLPEYFSPEQAEGKAPDTRSDVYVVGLIFYELLTGKPPFAARSVAGTLRRQISETPLPPRYAKPGLQLSPEAEAIVYTALNKDPGERFQSARAFRRAINDLRPEFSETSERGAAPLGIAPLGVLVDAPPPVPGSLEADALRLSNDEIVALSVSEMEAFEPEADNVMPPPPVEDGGWDLPSPSTTRASKSVSIEGELSGREAPATATAEWAAVDQDGESDTAALHVVEPDAEVEDARAEGPATPDAQADVDEPATDSGEGATREADERGSGDRESADDPSDSGSDESEAADTVERLDEEATVDEEPTVAAPPSTDASGPPDSAPPDPPFGDDDTELGWFASTVEPTGVVESLESDVDVRHNRRFWRFLWVGGAGAVLCVFVWSNMDGCGAANSPPSEPDEAVAETEPDEGGETPAGADTTAVAAPAHEGSGDNGGSGTGDGSNGAAPAEEPAPATVPPPAAEPEDDVPPAPGQPAAPPPSPADADSEPAAEPAAPTIEAPEETAPSAANSPPAQAPATSEPEAPPQRAALALAPPPAVPATPPNAPTLSAAQLEANRAHAQELADLGNAALSRNEPDRAAVLYEQALELDDTVAAAHAGLGDIAYGRGNYEGAALHHRRATRHASRNGRYHGQLGRDYYRLGNLDAAVASLERAAELGDDAAVDLLDTIRERVPDAQVAQE